MASLLQLRTFVQPHNHPTRRAETTKHKNRSNERATSQAGDQAQKTQAKTKPTTTKTKHETHQTPKIKTNANKKRQTLNGTSGPRGQKKERKPLYNSPIQSIDKQLQCADQVRPLCAINTKENSRQKEDRGTNCHRNRWIGIARPQT